MVPASPKAPLVTKVAGVACQGLYHSTSLCQLGEHRSQKSIHKIVLFCLRPPSTVEMLFGGHISPCSPTFGITYHEQCCNCPNQSLGWFGELIPRLSIITPTMNFPACPHQVVCECRITVTQVIYKGKPGNIQVKAPPDEEISTHNSVYNNFRHRQRFKTLVRRNLP